MWSGFRKGIPRSSDGKFATPGNDCGIGHKGDGSLDLSTLMQGAGDALRSGLPGPDMAGTAFDGLVLPRGAGAGG